MASTVEEDVSVGRYGLSSLLHSSERRDDIIISDIAAIGTSNESQEVSTLDIAVPLVMKENYEKKISAMTGVIVHHWRPNVILALVFMRLCTHGQAFRRYGFAVDCTPPVRLGKPYL